MKLKRTLIYLLAVSCMVLGIHTSLEAASFNHVDRVLTVMVDEKLQGSEAPVLGITLVDELEKGAIFYLDLTGGKWLEMPFASGDQLEVKRLSGTRLQVKVVGEGLAEGERFKIPMQLEMTASEAIVHVKGNNTVVTSGSYVLAQTASYKGEVTTSQMPMAVEAAVMADVMIEEPFSKAFSKAIKVEGCSNKIQLQLDHNGYAFDLLNSESKLIGSQGFEGIEGDRNAIKQIDEQTLEITLPDTSSAKYSGCFTLSGVRIKPSDKKVEQAVLAVTVVGDLVEKTIIDVLKMTDYTITLSANPRRVRAGTMQKLDFTLEELVEDSLVRNRVTSFTLSDGAYLVATAEGKVEVMLNDKPILCESILDEKGRIVGFQVARLPLGEKKYSFSVPINISLGKSGNVSLQAEGRSLVETLTAPVFEVYQPFKVEVSALSTIVGLKDQVGGKIVLSETSAAELIQGEKIILILEESAIKYGRLPKIEVTSGDLRLGSAVINGNRIEIPIVRRSNVASTVVISEFNVTVDQTVAEGGYHMQIGGGAFSNLTEEAGSQVVWEGPFVWVTQKHTSPDEVSYQERVTFTIGSKMYTVGELTKSMEAAPYISSGRTMLPVRYVAEAMGISPGAVIWNSEDKTVTIYAQDKIILQMGSKIMKLSGEEVMMAATPEAVSGRVFIPVAELTRALRIETKWDAVSKQVSFIVNKTK